MKVVAVYEAGWTQCQSAQGMFYFNLKTDEISMTLPPDAGVLAAEKPQMEREARPTFGFPEDDAQELVLHEPLENAQPGSQYQMESMELAYQHQVENIPALPQAQQHEFCVHHQPSLSPQPTGAHQASIAQPPPNPALQQEAPAIILQELGAWMICEDANGEFYWHTPTSQSYDVPPQDLLVLHRQFKQEQGREQEIRQQALRETWMAKQQQLKAERQLQNGSQSAAKLHSNIHMTYRPQAQALRRQSSSSALYRYQHGLPQ